MRRAGRRDWLPWAALAAGIVLTVSTVILIHGNRAAPTDAGALESVVTVTPTATLAPTIHPTAHPATATRPPKTTTRPTTVAASSKETASTPPTTSAAADPTQPAPAQPTARSGTPQELVLPSLGITAQVSRVDSVAGVLQVPEDISTVGWWQSSVPAGSRSGTTVIDGHIDSAVAGKGALFHLAELNPGDHIQVKTVAGHTLTYQVQARRVYVKAQGLPAELFNQQGPPRLVIISCGGPFDSTEHSYLDNIAIYATPTN
jgi:hypothetical protein